MIDNTIQSPFETMQAGDHMNAEQFASQASAGTGVFGSPGLQQDQTAYSAQVPRSVMPTNSGNGMSADQFEQTLGGEFPVDNAMAARQYQTAKFTMRRNA